MRSEIEIKLYLAGIKRLKQQLPSETSMLVIDTLEWVLDKEGENYAK